MTSKRVATGTAKMTWKGQITLPSGVRQAMGLQPGDQVSFRVDGRKVRVTKIGSGRTPTARRHER